MKPERVGRTRKEKGHTGMQKKEVEREMTEAEKRARFRIGDLVQTRAALGSPWRGRVSGFNSDPLSAWGVLVRFYENRVEGTGALDVETQWGPDGLTVLARPVQLGDVLVVSVPDGIVEVGDRLLVKEIAENGVGGSSDKHGCWVVGWEWVTKHMKCGVPIEKGEPMMRRRVPGWVSSEAQVKKEILPAIPEIRAEIQDPETLARVLFETDDRIRNFVWKKAEVDEGRARWEWAMGVAWERDEFGARTQARMRAREMIALMKRLRS